ncbi:MAG: asparagine synthase (glutamine-hydrolyzing) [Sulfitobacter sp.]|nr:asparagine synthase (glutamine-hydrolyzing) [Sulfitobacter sp.]
MCGFVVIAGDPQAKARVRDATALLAHRGPDAEGHWQDPSGTCVMGHRRLSIIDLSEGARQPMTTPDGRFHLVFNGEIYNYLELRRTLASGYEFTTRSDTEVLLAAFRRWGDACLDRVVGMFAFVIWDDRDKRLFAARDRFGVKPLYYRITANGLLLASEIKALHALGVPREPDSVAWATYFASGFYDHAQRTFWKEILPVPPGSTLTWATDASAPRIGRWYDLAERVPPGCDGRSEHEIKEALRACLDESVSLRLRSDVPVGVCLSGGLDSSLLLALLQRTQGEHSRLKTFTFHCGDPRYDETPWVRRLVERTQHPAFFAELRPEMVPGLATRVQWAQDEPFGGIPTLGMALVHARAREEGVTVLLDGSGMDEAWAGYDYYRHDTESAAAPVQGARSPTVRADCLCPEFAALAEPFDAPRPWGDRVRDLQYRDIGFAKIPRAMRFADRVSMVFSRELREPFLDHRLIELGLHQPMDRKIRFGQGKFLVRQIAEELLPRGVSAAPKRPLQTPQREWLRGPLRDWAGETIDSALSGWGGDWLDPRRVRGAWDAYCREGADNSFPVWQWVSLGLMSCTDRSVP